MEDRYEEQLGRKILEGVEMKGSKSDLAIQILILINLSWGLTS